MPDTATATGTTALTWFEIPTADLERARRFYATILEAPLRSEVMAGQRIAIFPYERPGVGGALVEAAHPSPHGTIVYLNVDGRLDRTLELAASSGGRVALPKTELPHAMGWIAKIVDSEGNQVGLHAMS